MKKAVFCCILLLFGGLCSAGLIVADADGYSDGTDLSSEFAGITLSSVGNYAGLGGRFLRKADALRAVTESVRLYNYRRPHQSLGYRVPMEVHRAA